MWEVHLLDKDLLTHTGETKQLIRKSVLWNVGKLAGMIVFYYALAYMISHMVQRENISWLWVGVALVVALIFRVVAIRKGAKNQAVLVSEVKGSIRRALFEKVHQLGIRYTQVISTSDMINMGVDTIEQLENYYGRFVTEFYTCFLSGILLFVAIAPISLKVAVILLLLTPIIPLMLRAILKMVTGRQKKYWRKYQDIGGLFLDSLQGLTTLKIFRADQKRADELAHRSELFRKETMKILTMQLNSITIIEWIAFGGTIAGMIVGIQQFRLGTIDLFSVLVIFFLSAEVFRPMISLTSSFHVAMTGVAAGKRMNEFLSLEVENLYGEKKLSSDVSIGVEGLTYHYQSDQLAALDDVSMQCKKGEITAIVGVSGCGKSTLAKLISAELLPPEGVVTYQSLADREYDISSIATSITRVSHLGHLFEGTVESNLRASCPDAEEIVLQEALKKVQMWEEIEDRGGLACPVHSGGTNFSGGQKQRLCIARALLHQSSVYIFDEATSNIDVESEQIILDVIRSLRAHHTIVMITHRLKNVQQADKIYVMERGCIIQEGTHDALIQMSGVYQSLFTEQEQLESYRKVGGNHERA